MNWLGGPNSIFYLCLMGGWGREAEGGVEGP